LPFNVTADAKNILFSLVPTAGNLVDLSLKIGTTAGANDIYDAGVLTFPPPVIFGPCVLPLIATRTTPITWYITVSPSLGSGNTVYFTLTSTEIYQAQNIINGVNITLASKSYSNMMHYFDVSDASIPVSLKLVMSITSTIASPLLSFYILENGCATILSDTYLASQDSNELDLTLTSTSQPPLAVARYSVLVTTVSAGDAQGSSYYLGSCFGAGCTVTIPAGPWNANGGGGSSAARADANIYTMVATGLVALGFIVSHM